MAQWTTSVSLSPGQQEQPPGVISSGWLDSCLKEDFLAKLDSSAEPAASMKARHQPRVSRSIISRWWGYLAVNSSLFPISKSSNSNPGATVQPTRAHDVQSATRDANQHPARTTA